MNPVNFCYWLQGARELCGINDPTKEQTWCIRDHLALVVSSAGLPANLGQFIADLRAAWRFGSPEWTRVWSDLSDVFEHTIDKMAAGHQHTLNHIHGPNPDGLMIRC